MADDERAAKAARARALLKKRQQQKATGGASSPNAAAGESISRIASPSPPPSRSFTPAPQEATSPNVPSHVPSSLRGEAVAEGSKDLGDLFSQIPGNGAADNDWLSSLTPVDAQIHAPPPYKPSLPSPVASRRQSAISPHPIASPPSRPSSTKPGERDDLRALIQEQARTIASLESEKAVLANKASEQSRESESKLQKLLDDERGHVESLQSELRGIQVHVNQLTSRGQEQSNRISALESEKAALSASIKALEKNSATLLQTEALLRDERENVKNARAIIERLQSDQANASRLAEEQQRRITTAEAKNASLESSLQELSATRARVQQLESELADNQHASASYQEQIQELQESLDELSSRSEQQQQTISLLVSEKTTLTSQVEQLQLAESDLAETSMLLEVERSRAERLHHTVQQLETQNHEYSERVEDLTTKERELTDRTRDLEREVNHLTNSFDELRSLASESQRRVRELEEQIESDDRAERLEATLQHTQDRAAELEFQVSKLKQAQSTLKSERDELERQLRAQRDSEASWQSRHADIEKQYSSNKEQLSSITSERDALLRDKSALQSQVDELRVSLTEVQQKLSQTAAEMMTSVRALQQTQTELRNANRRADEAEQIQKDLRTEGLGLMRSLDEMRPKIVELTDVKLELGEKVATLEQAVSSRDSVISQLEASLDELRDQKGDLEKEVHQVKVALERERSSLNENASELQKAYVDLQNELESTRSNAKHLEEERTEYRNMATRNMEEVDRLSSSLHTSAEQISALRSELVERSDARQEAQEFLERARQEMEALHAELAAKDAEIERLQEAASYPTTTNPTTPNGGPHSWDEEMLSALKQQHDLELSSAQSEIRHLETVIFQAEARAHSLQKHVSVLEEQLAHFRPSSRGGTVPHRTTARVGISDELRRSSFGSYRPNNLNPPPSNFDGLSPETRHKRKVSLSMLKARIDSEAAVKSKTMSPAQKLSGLPSVAEQDQDSSRSSPVIVNSARRAPQFLDESHVFWCSSCHGDLVIL